MEDKITKKVIVKIETEKKGYPVVVAVEQIEGEIKIKFLEDLEDCVQFDPQKQVLVDDNMTLEIAYSKSYS